MAEQKDVRSPLLTKTPKLQLTAEQTSTTTTKCWNPPRKMRYVLTKKPQYDDRRGAISIKSDPVPVRRATHKLEIITEVVQRE